MRGQLQQEAAAEGKMELMHAGLLLSLFCSALSYQFRSGGGYGLFVQDPELEWERMETVIGEKITRTRSPKPKFWRSASSSGTPSPPEAKKVRNYVAVSSAKDQKEAFKPEKGARPLPKSVKENLLGGFVTDSGTARAATRPRMIEMLCHVDRMYVRIRREIFKSRDAYKYLKLGKCPVNQGTKEHYYLLYLLTNDCGFKIEVTKGVFICP